jgi:small-conductance mechanosensitive channel
VRSCVVPSSRIRAVGGIILAAMTGVSSAAAADPAAAREFSTTGFAVSAVLITLGLCAWIALIIWLRSRILSRLRELTLQQTKRIASRRLRQVSVQRLSQLAVMSTRLGAVAAGLAGFFVWATALLDLVPAMHDVAVRVEHAVIVEIERLALIAVRAVPDLCIVALIYFATRFIHEMLNHYFRSITAGEVKSSVFDEVTAETTRRLADIGLWVAAVIIAFPYIPGSESAAFRGVSVLAGLMLSLGSANLVGQFASGLSLIYGRALKPGEYIACGETEGVVEQVGMFACSIRTPRDEVVVLSHTVVASGLKNYSRRADRVRLTTEVTIGYDAPWRQVRDLLLAAAAETEGIRAEPAPSVRQVALEDFYVRYELQFTPLDPAERCPLLCRLHGAIQDRFHEAGVQIMSPNYRGDPQSPKIPRGPYRDERPS